MNLFKWNDGKSSSICILVGSETEGIFDLGFLRKKNSCRCRILKFCVYISLGMLGSQKVFFNPDKNLFKRNEGKSRTVFILVGFEREGIFDMGFYKKKCSCRCQILRLYKSRYARFTKSVFNLVKDLLNEMRSTVLIWRGLEKITHVVVKFCAYISLGMLGWQKVFHFQSSQELVQTKWGQK